ncbi:putative Ser/Thr phosphatase family protein [Blattamonas nauphoetae]|uniref:Ser/Thr phosphatase family protein n=1 Tax=Blattamonas nauphoetae TaxID=2049346 RepID=A0ABQ9XCQ6_9EUKA|nr:putative Ser/Thr phosphatase family protein [Blattamonas nauphoetae]
MALQMFGFSQTLRTPTHFVFLLVIGEFLILFPTITFKILIHFFPFIEKFMQPISICYCSATILHLIVGVYIGQERVVRRLTIKSSKLKDTTSIVQLSDLHVGSLPPSILVDVVTKVNELEPDFVFITGDLVDSHQIVRDSMPSPGSKCLDPTNPFYPLVQLNAKYGTFFVMGNHDVMSGRDSVAEILSACPNITTLVNDFVDVQLKSGAQVRVIGIEDGSTSYFQQMVTELEPRLAEKRPADFTVLLHHRPAVRVWRKAMEMLGCDLFLAGHTHAGQIKVFSELVKLAFDGPVWVKLLRKRRISRYSEERLTNLDEPFMYTNPGTGMFGTAIRSSKKNEITLFRVNPLPET